jgi:hypothetical protein
MWRTIFKPKLKMRDFEPVCFGVLNQSLSVYDQTIQSSARFSLYRANKVTHRVLPSELKCHSSLRTLQIGSGENLLVPLNYYFLSTSSAILSKERKESVSEKPGIVKKFKKMFKEYWYVFVPVHVATSSVWLGTFYLMLKSGVDIVSFLQYVGTSQRILDYMSDSEAGYYALSYACYKIASPLRYTITVAGTTLTISKLKDTGYLKSTSEVAEKIKDKTDDLKEKYEDQRDKVKEEWENAWERFSKRKK